MFVGWNLDGMWIDCFTSACSALFLLFITFIALLWALFIHFLPFCLTVNPLPAPMVPHPPPSTFPFYLLLSTLLFLVNFIPPSLIISTVQCLCLTPAPPSCFLFSPSVFCVSRTLMVTQIFWLLAVPWGWDAVSALHLEVLYIFLSVSILKPLCFFFAVMRIDLLT